MTRFALIPSLVVLVLLVGAPAAKADWTWPLRGEVITSYRNGDDPYAAGQHRGIDIAASVGAAVVAAAAGDVRFAGVAGSSGLTVSVRTGDGRLDTSYLHLSSAAVEAGERVAIGQRLGAVGTSGHRSAVAPHLHFGVRDAGTQRYHDPLGLLPPLASVPELRPQPPAPVTVPAPVAPEPEPVARRLPASEPEGVPDSRPRRVPASQRRRVPNAQPRRVPAPQSQRAPQAGLRREPVRRRLPAERRLAIPQGELGRASAPTPRRLAATASGDRIARRRAPGLDAASQRHARAHGASGQAAGSAARRQPVAPVRGVAGGGAGRADRSPIGAGGGGPRAGGDSSGPDAGWALACLGLLAAAALVGTGGGGRTAVRRGRGAVQRLLGPLARRGQRGPAPE